VFGQKIAQAFANNGDLIANILYNLSAVAPSSASVARASFRRPFENAWRRCTPGRRPLAQQALELQSELQQTEAN